jgi:nitrogen fixation protein FixH
MIGTGEQAAGNKAAGRKWAAVIVGLISMNVCIVAVTVVCATRDKSFAIEPDYYKKAVEWDRSALERDRGAALGWGVSVALTPARPGSTEPVVRVSLNGPPSAGAPLDGAQVQVEAFAQARSGARLKFYAEGVGGGLYEGAADISRPGLWEVRLRVRRGPDSLSLVRTLVVPGSAEGASR